MLHGVRELVQRLPRKLLKLGSMPKRLLTAARIAVTAPRPLPCLSVRHRSKLTAKTSQVDQLRSQWLELAFVRGALTRGLRDRESPSSPCGILHSGWAPQDVPDPFSNETRSSFHQFSLD